MRLLIASDIHGSAYYCRKLLERWEIERPEKMVLLGDLLYHGPRNDLPREYAPKEVIAMLNGISQELLCVRGNCEAEVDQMVLDFPVMAEYMIIYDKGRMFFITHGHVFNK
ncbi:MAG: phosphodiesterase, partial [Lachnospiraceae bacterium]